jgi:hypothetical protein
MCVAWEPFSGDISGRTAAMKPSPIKDMLEKNRTTSAPSRCFSLHEKAQGKTAVLWNNPKEQFMH